jgi:hypothetical protein
MKLRYPQRKTKSLSESIAAKLQGRNTLSVSRHLVNRYPPSGDNIRVEWTPKDDLALKRLVAKKGTQWKLIAEELGRPPNIVRLHYKDYVSLGEKRKAGTWTMSEKKKLYAVVMKKLKKSDWKEKEGLDIDVVSAHVDWSGISKEMGRSRSRAQCRSKWLYLPKWKNSIQGEEEDENVEEEEDEQDTEDSNEDDKED